MWKSMRWYDKVVYVVGWIATILILVSFLVGFADGVQNG